MQENANLITKDQARELLRGAQKILVAPSAPMDGDSVGSALALMLTLQKMGKEVTVVAYDKVPDGLKFLPEVEAIQSEVPESKDFVISLSTSGAEVEHLKYEVENGKINIIVTPKTGRFNPQDLEILKKNPEFDLIVTVDTGDLVQLGKLYENHKDLFVTIPVLNIDHHASNGKFGTHNYLEYKFSATTQMITPILQDFEKEMGEELIDEDVATLLLVGIITDTGSFQHSNTTPEAFEVAADLLDRGARQQDIIKHIYKTKSLSTLKLWGRVLSKIEYDPVHKMVYSTITKQDLEDTGAASDDTGGIIDELMTSAPDAEVVFLLKEKEPGFVSGSMRAPGHLADVSQIAQQMNGGGHKKAAGFRLRNMSISEALEVAKKTVANFMAPRLGLKLSQEDASSTEIHSIGEKEAFAQADFPQAASAHGTLFPGLTAHPSRPQSSIPVPSPGGEDLLLKDFRARSDAGQLGNAYTDPREAFIRETSARFFQDADGQVRSMQNGIPDGMPNSIPNKIPEHPASFGPTATVEDVLRQYPQN